MDKRKLIFLVDDDPTNLAVGASALEGQYDVLRLNSGERLLKKLEKSIPDLILLDVEMPEMNGYDVIKLLKGNPGTASIPVIFLTAKSDVESELTGLSLGATDYILKPFSPPLLLKRIEVHLLLESQKRELIGFNNNLKEMVEAKTKAVVDLQKAVIKTMADLVEYRDDITGNHIDRVRLYLEVLLGAMRREAKYSDEISKWDMELVLQSSQLHDVGKITVKDNVLKKNGKLTPEEFEEIKEHTILGEKIIAKTMARLEDPTEQAFLEYAGIFAAYHHEKWDGTGYHRGIAGEDIPLLGRAMAIADVYDALISKRPYKNPMPHEDAVSIIVAGRGSHFDPALVDIFIAISGEFNKIASRVGQ